MDYPLCSVICVSNRPLFIPGVLEMFRAQTYPWKELILIDASEGGAGIDRALADGCKWLDPPHDFLYEQAPVGCKVPVMRNQGMKHARGEYMAWMDDDGWHDPTRLKTLMEEMQKEEVRRKGKGPEKLHAIGTQGNYWTDLRGDFYHYRGTENFPLSGTMVWHRVCFERHQFAAKFTKASDHYWISNLRDDPEINMAAVHAPTLCVGMSHGFNLSNPKPPALARPVSNVSMADFYPDQSFGLQAHVRRLKEACEKMRGTA